MRQPWLSATQILMWLRCPRQFWYRYVMGIKVPPNGALKQGSTYHMVAERNYVQKVSSRVDLPEDELTDYFGDTFEAEMTREEVRLVEGESKGALKDQGIELVKTFHAAIAPHVQPAQVETQFEVNMGQGDENVLLKGRIDVIDEHGIVRDNKTLAPTRVPTAEELATDVQLSIYSLAYRLTTKKAEPLLTWDAVIKKTWPEARILPTARNREGLRLTFNQIGHVGKAIRNEIFPTNPTGWWCSPRWCGYYPDCQGKALVTVDLSANLETVLKESLERHEKEKGREESRQEGGKKAAQSRKEGSKARGKEETGSDDAA